ncbi:MAG: D-alanyl-D-alanine carboxypeptidase family protein [Pseudomonadota bacterium]
MLASPLPALADDLGLRTDPPHILVDTADNRILDGHRIDQRWAPASLTKMMTAYTVFRALELQHLKLDSPVRISETALAQPPTKMGYPIGTILTIETALKIILVKSANDVSVALAESVAGSEEAFVALMNSHARRLHLDDTQFQNPHGLHDPEQFTSARDMALLTRQLQTEFRHRADFFNIPALRITNRRLRNHNALLRLFEGTNGMKTGYVCASGFNVVVTVTRGERDLMVVVFGGRSGLERNVKAAKLLTEGFDGRFDDGALERIGSGRQRTSGGIPDDITRVMCPGKYAEVGTPVLRPETAPSADEFDAIDTSGSAPRENLDETQAGPVVLPLKRPDFRVVKEPESAADMLAVSEREVDQERVPEDNPPTLSELADLYLQPVSDPGEEQSLSLGGATGPNPFGILHTNGGRYVAPIPVPDPNPALDLKKPDE